MCPSNSFNLLFIYKAGECLPFPCGCLKHELDVKLDIEERCVPQYLQVYFVFSLPSYRTCLPRPSGCLLHELIVKLDTLDDFVPQFAQ